MLERKQTLPLAALLLILHVLAPPAALGLVRPGQVTYSATSTQAVTTEMLEDEIDSILMPAWQGGEQRRFWFPDRVNGRPGGRHRIISETAIASLLRRYREAGWLITGGRNGVAFQHPSA
jgi:hypothetical protein